MTNRSPWVSFRIPPADAADDIERWNEAVNETFGPFVRRKRVLHDHRIYFRTELVNMWPIARSPQLSKILLEQVKLCRRTIYKFPTIAHEYQSQCVGETSEADDKWLNIISTLNYDDNSAHPTDRASRMLTTIDSICEACIKTRVKYIYGFSKIIDTQELPDISQSFGSIVSSWPNQHFPLSGTILYDPIFHIPISQWRNLANHRNYTRASVDNFTAHYGPQLQHSVTFTLDQLSAILEWVIATNAVFRMAAIVIDIEFMEEIMEWNPNLTPVRFDAFLIVLSHNLRMVGFSYVSHEVSEGLLTISFFDDLQRSAIGAIIHLSQTLDIIANAADDDLDMHGMITHARVALVSGSERAYATATVAIEAARFFAERKSGLEDYIDCMEFWTEVAEPDEEEVPGNA